MPPTLVYRDAPLLGVGLGLWLADWARRRSVDAMSVTALVALLLSFWSVRFVPLAVTAIVPGMASLSNRGLRWLGERAGPQVRASIRSALAGVVAIGIVALSYFHATKPSSAGLGLEWWSLPVESAEFLRAHPPPGRMYNSFNLGGYLLFALGPEQKVFIDGRNDTVYSAGFFAEYVRADRDPQVFFHLLERYQVTYAVVECTTADCRDLPFLQASPDWQPVYLDDAAIVLVKNVPATRDYLDRYGYRTLRAYDGVPRVFALDRDPSAPELEREVLRNAAESPRSLRAQFLAAAVHRIRGRAREYQLARAAYVALALERDLIPNPP
jgi:hypothetical protein